MGNQPSLTFEQYHSKLYLVADEILRCNPVPRSTNPSVHTFQCDIFILLAIHQQMRSLYLKQVNLPDDVLGI